MSGTTSNLTSLGTLVKYTGQIQIDEILETVERFAVVWSIEEHIDIGALLSQTDPELIILSIYAIDAN